MTKPVSPALNQTYYGPNGDPLTFWSLAPAFPTSFAVPTSREFPRHFVWLYSNARQVFVHAVISPLSDRVLAVGGRELLESQVELARACVEA